MQGRRLRQSHSCLSDLPKRSYYRIGRRGAHIYLAKKLEVYCTQWYGFILDQKTLSVTM